MSKVTDVIERLWESDAVPALDALKEADDAVETINRDMFNTLADAAATIVNGTGTPVQDVKDTFKAFEQRYKKERGLKHMPGSYRSAKSAIVNAVANDVALRDEDGDIKGKSALEREVNQQRRNNKRNEPLAKTVASTIMYARMMIEEDADASVPDKRNLRDQIENMERLMQELREYHEVDKV